MRAVGSNTQEVRALSSSLLSRLCQKSCELPIVQMATLSILDDNNICRRGVTVIGTTDARVACSSVFTRPIFKLTSAKFHTFAYNSRTVGSSYMKFWQQFEINELYVCTQFRGNRSRDFGFRIRKPPRKFGVKSGLSQKRLKYGKKYFIGLYVSRYPFIPTNPLLAAMRFISFFSFFFFLNFVRSSPKPQNIEI